MTSSSARHIALVGGGFSGTLTAVNLGRLCKPALRVTVLNHGYPSGRGIAYSTLRPEHLLNVAARNMSAFPDHPNHFVDWLRTRVEFHDLPDAELREVFAPRRVYGEYLLGLKLPYLRPVDHRSRVAIEKLEAEAVEISARPHGGRIHLADGGHLDADRIVLATGNEPPADLPGGELLVGQPGWCANPWTPWENRLPSAGESVVLLGTGLTTVDAILTLLALGWSGPIHAVSRNGLLPESHFKGVDDPYFPPSGVDLAGLGLLRLVALVEEHCVRLRSEGKNPAMIVDRMRPYMQPIWQGFSESERREFAARHAARWNVIRHRIAPSIHRRVSDAIASGQLRIVRASVDRVEAAGSRIGVNLRQRDGTSARLEGSLVINCTGPHTRFSATRSRLLQVLLSSGLAQPDAMDMGIRVNPDFSLVERGGGKSPFLYALGPLLRGTLWETIAVPELRGQAMRVAENLLDGLNLAQVKHASRAEDAVIEYMI